jgi:RNA polymerase sigma factor (sigma-70 family)
LPTPEFSGVGVVMRIKSGDSSAKEELYQAVTRTIGNHLRRRVGEQDYQDRIGDTFVAILTAIENGTIESDASLAKYIWGVANNHVNLHIRAAVRARRCSDAASVAIADERAHVEQALIVAEHKRIAQEVFSTVPEREREVLTRFYVKGQTLDQISTEMGLSYAYVGWIKFQARARVIEKARRRFRLAS